MRVKFLWLVLGLLPLAGCQTLNFTSSDAGAANEPVATTTDPALRPTPSRRQSARTTSPARTYPPPSHLKGMDTLALTKFLGKPGFRRADAPAEIWHYPGTGCTLYVFLYRNEKSSPLKVDYIETRATGAKTVYTKACFASVIEKNGGASTG